MPSQSATWAQGRPSGWWHDQAQPPPGPPRQRTQHAPENEAHRHAGVRKSVASPSSPSSPSSGPEDESDGEWTEGKSQPAHVGPRNTQRRTVAAPRRIVTTPHIRTSQGNGRVLSIISASARTVTCANAKPRQLLRDHKLSAHMNRLLSAVVAGYPMVHGVREAEFPAIERRNEPYIGFELVFVDPLDISVRYWWPAMVVPPTQIDRFMRLPYPGTDECLVRYFEDNKFSMVKMKDIVPFTLDSEPYLHFSRNYPEFLEDTGVRKALRYLRTGILPRRFAWKGWRDMREGGRHLLPYGCAYRVAQLAHVDEPSGSFTGSDHDDDEASSVGSSSGMAYPSHATESLYGQRRKLPEDSLGSDDMVLTTRGSRNGVGAHGAGFRQHGRGRSRDDTSSVEAALSLPMTARGLPGPPRRRQKADTASAAISASGNMPPAPARAPPRRDLTRTPDEWDHIHFDESGQQRTTEEREELYRTGFARLAEMQSEYRQLKRSTRELARELFGRHETGGAITRSRRRKLVL
ncbi:hypothetical protein THASP1DRAFT_29525 [Thamnocephalis sphaerospora]|uniref:PWWP domain-containing protein n=1 Tax=Thamnocephalis sphaerospora TaxID=78915 RepID=A0A4P9XT35_9FUNG|nr:hypothetical protein THASP1DRAFT_29525 [Thamnocephalis sphaerospora]|eukprot:RKP08691.1 hypothetical protein THASP1DRAFT_29525 [Thamnocephalis sphaerospora]